MKRLIEKMVCLGLVTAWRLATWPTSRSPSLVNATTDGVVRPPSALGMTTGSPPSITATTELVVPRSIPMILEAMSTPVRNGGARAGAPGLPAETATARGGSKRHTQRLLPYMAGSPPVTRVTTAERQPAYDRSVGERNSGPNPRRRHAVDHLRDPAGAVAAGVVTSYTLGGFIHVLLMVAIVIAILQLLQGRRAL